jgi:primosomal protein N' (replication factor Y)
MGGCTVSLGPLFQDESRLVSVAVLAPVSHPLTYLVPEGVAVPAPGTRVLCPLGPREVTGVVLAAQGVAPVEGMRPLAEVLDVQPLWSPDLLEAVRFCADYYLSPVGEVVRAALPPGLTPRSARVWRLTAAGRLALASPEASLLGELDLHVLAALADRPRTPRALHASLGVTPGRMGRLAARGLVDEARSLRGQSGAPEDEVWVALQDGTALPARARVLAAVDAHLQARGEATTGELASVFPGARTQLKRLESLGRARVETRTRALTDPYASFPTPVAPEASQLTEAQRDAVAQVAGALGGFHAFLLEGVTGSGKTEVYLRAIAACRERGQTALVLVPEIALTPSLAARFRGRVAGGVAVLHSGLTASDRLAAYDAARHGRVGAVLGARSAVFAPLWNLGLVVVDEEHDGSYKQDESPRYQGRDLALFRAKAACAVCVLGSATPSLESAHGVATGRLTHLVLAERPGARPLPQVELVNLRRRRARTPAAGVPAPVTSDPLVAGADVPILSRRLCEELEATLREGEQALVFLNRRGFNASILCMDCGESVTCPNCAVSLTHHAPRTPGSTKTAAVAGSLRCHYCDHRQDVPPLCPSCGGDGLWPMGLGVQRVEAEVVARFPSARVARLDRDAVQHKGALERILTAFAAREVDVLVGTQMLAKGHDYPGVTLVGVVMADMSLSVPDWRASERTLQLLTQVAGRCGRGDRPGKVIIQTYNPEHDAIACASRHDVRTFTERELRVRADLGYPPFKRMGMVRTESGDEATAMAWARSCADVMRVAGRVWAEQVQVLGPAPAPLARLKGTWRYQVFVLTATVAQRGTMLHAVRRHAGGAPAGCKVVVDVDPGSVM